MKLSIVEPFAARPAPENQGEEEMINDLSALVVPKVEAQTMEDSSSTDKEESLEQKIVYLDFMNAQKKQQLKMSGHTDKTRAKAHEAYIKSYDSISRVYSPGSRLHKRA